jgi:hypothetical protein
MLSFLGVHGYTCFIQGTTGRLARVHPDCFDEYAATMPTSGVSDTKCVCAHEPNLVAALAKLDDDDSTHVVAATHAPPPQTNAEAAKPSSVASFSDPSVRHAQGNVQGASANGGGGVRGGGSSRDAFDRDGYTILRDVLSTDEVAQMARSVSSYIAGGGGGGAKIWRNGIGYGGWFVLGFPKVAALRGVMEALHTKPKLHDALGELMRGEYQMLTRNELYAPPVPRSLHRFPSHTQ